MNIRSEAVGLVSELLRDMDRDLLLVMRSTNLIRSINSAIGANKVNRQLSMARKSMDAILIADQQDDVHYGVLMNVSRRWKRFEAHSQYSLRVSLFSWLRWLGTQLNWRMFSPFSDASEELEQVVDEYM